MKKSLLKNSLKTIIKNKKRFLSMLFMALLGVGFFAGLTASSPDMEDTLDKYLDETKTYDISIVATLGLTDEEIEKLEKIDGVENAYGVKNKDYLIGIDAKEYVAQVIQYNENINNPYIAEGKIPEGIDECLLDEKFALYNNYKIGDKIEIKTEDEDVLQKELTIVGLCKSSLYISNERGTTTLGTGKIDCYIYVKDILDFDYYTTIYAKVSGAIDVKSQSKKYDELIEKAKENIEEIKEEREEARRNQLIEDAKKQMIAMGFPEENLQFPNVEQNKWYIQTRTDNAGYYGIVQAIESITNLARVFPIVFYIIAVLISLTSMTRMVEEERTEIRNIKGNRIF